MDWAGIQLHSQFPVLRQVYKSTKVVCWFTSTLDATDLSPISTNILQGTEVR